MAHGQYTRAIAAELTSSSPIAPVTSSEQVWDYNQIDPSTGNPKTQEQINEELYMASGGGINVINDLTTGGTTDPLSAEMGKTLAQQIAALSSGAKLSMSVSPTVIYKATSSLVTVSASMSGVTPSTIIIKDGNTSIASVTNNVSASVQRTFSITDGSKTYTAEAIYNGVTFKASVTLNARYPIYCGFGVSAAAVATSNNKIGATTTAARTYSKTASSNGQYFFILIPTDITDVSTFTMGGAPFAMETVTTTTIEGVTYKVHKSSYSYNSGTALNVKAE